ncbi:MULTISPECIES: alpha/beta hydrolase [unclassified Cellulophaga]|uniref:alpha/beta hydrolase n=1 Tax=unclassified Cellulophaga TaxID=2634405 RepID=UPI0026E32C77|nr:MULTISPECIES: alpha/beta hydrolase-fold protein [unclassified Cellulophaga]MDO6490193.1 alpha/beta hydrolase-fold protein [Cellulophaga sp. 2_MG-2023]MDO6494613.1 alpha/beta hydrolase-fold protein [Cellulophaga sp. 3_MG-2023]
MKLIVSIFLLFLTTNSFCQSHSFYSKPDTLIIKSKIFDTERKITVSLPLDYEKIKEPKNLIVYVDGDNEEITGTILQATNNLYLYDDIPQSILVGIFHQDRNEELVEKKKLFKFLDSEVIPMIANKYNIKKKITIVGHSFGGYFSTYCFLKNNTVFNNCISISPAYWPNDSDIYDIVKKELEKESKLTGNLYLAIGDKRWDDISLREDFFKFTTILEKGDNNINFQYNDLVGFNHNSSPTVGFGLGLNFCFDQLEWNSVIIDQNNRIKSFPDFWQHYELKADALKHLEKYKEANEAYKVALNKLKLDKEVSVSDKEKIENRLQKKMKK